MSHLTGGPWVEPWQGVLNGPGAGLDDGARCVSVFSAFANGTSYGAASKRTLENLGCSHRDLKDWD